MHDLSAKPVFFVQDTPRAVEFYTNTLGFNLDWTHEESSQPYVQHVQSRGIAAACTQWGAPTMVIYDQGRNEIYFWLSDAERVKWQEAHAVRLA